MWTSADKPSPYIEMGKIYTPGRGFLNRNALKPGSNTNDKSRSGFGSGKTTDHVAIIFTEAGELYLFTSYWNEQLKWDNEKKKTKKTESYRF